MREIWKYNEYSKTAGLFLYFLNLKLNHISAYGFKIKNAYLADYGNPKDYGCECVFIRLSSISTSSDEIGVLKVFERRPDTLLDSYMLEEDLIIVVKVPSNLLKDLNHFRKGEYSRIRKELALEYFAFSDVRFGVLRKSLTLRLYLEKVLGVEISESAELADPPDPSKEILRFDEGIFKKDIHLWAQIYTPEIENNSKFEKQL